MEDLAYLDAKDCQDYLYEHLLFGCRLLMLGFFIVGTVCDVAYLFTFTGSTLVQTAYKVYGINSCVHPSMHLPIHQQLSSYEMLQSGATLRVQLQIVLPTQAAVVLYNFTHSRSQIAGQK